VVAAGILTLPREYGAFRVAVAWILSTGEGAEREIAVGAAVLALSTKCRVKFQKVSASTVFQLQLCSTLDILSALQVNRCFMFGT
jgi:hypothetical protein